MKKKSKLGRFLLQSWGKKSKSSKNKSVRTRRLKKNRGLGFKYSHPKVSLKISLRSARKYSLGFTTQTAPQQLPPIEAPAPQELSPVTDVPISTSSAVIVQEVQVQEPQLQLPIEFRTLSSAELIRPQEKLKQSIEGFLLDQRSEHTRRAYGKDLKRFMMFLSARNFQHGPSELNRTILITYKESLLSEGLEHTTVDRHLATLRSFFNWLVEDGLLFRSPADGVRFLNPKRLSKTIGFTDEEVKKILAVPDLHTRVGSLHYAILMVLFYCGLRRSEACSLRTTHLGTERNQRVIRLRGKGNAERVIVMIPPVWNALKHLFLITRRDLSADQFLFRPIRNNRTQDLEKAVDPSMIFYIVTKYAKLAGVANRVSPHSCRATAISNARDHHVPDRAIQEFAGWASPDMITRYDKRRSAIEDSAAHAISYGAENRILPETRESFSGASSTGIGQDVVQKSSSPLQTEEIEPSFKLAESAIEREYSQEESSD